METLDFMAIGLRKRVRAQAHAALSQCGDEAELLHAPNAGDAAYDEYVSDPAKPVPFRARPTQPVGYDIEIGLTWPQWLVDDQREASGRPDVLAFTSDVLTAPVKISGQPVANLVASTSGTDSDWVVKLIDVYPDEVAGQRAMGGYQLVVAMDIFRGRYRESLETPKPIAADKPLLYRFDCPQPTTFFCPDTASWCRCNQAGFRSMTAIRRRLFRIFSGPSPAIIKKPRSGFTIAGTGKLCGVAGGERAIVLLKS